MFPFNETKLFGNRVLREFAANTNPDDLVWHRDREDRKLSMKEGRGWMLQLDNQLPVIMESGKIYEVKAGVYHRLIKGNGRLVLEIHKGPEIFSEAIINNPEEMSYEDAIIYLGELMDDDRLQNDIIITDAEDGEIEQLFAGMNAGDALSELEEPGSTEPKFPEDEEDYSYSDDPWDPNGPTHKRVGEYLYDEVELGELLGERNPQTGEIEIENPWYDSKADPEDRDGMFVRPMISMDEFANYSEFDPWVLIPQNIRRPDGQPFDSEDLIRIPEQFKRDVRYAAQGNVTVEVRPRENDMSHDPMWYLG